MFLLSFTRFRINIVPEKMSVEEEESNAILLNDFPMDTAETGDFAVGIVPEITGEGPVGGDRGEIDG